MKRLIFIFLIVPTLIFSQNSKLDSLQKVLEKETDDLSKVKLLTLLAHEYNNINIERSISFSMH